MFTLTFYSMYILYCAAVITVCCIIVNDIEKGRL
jgi:hypothetical protein